MFFQILLVLSGVAIGAMLVWKLSTERDKKARVKNALGIHPLWYQNAHSGIYAITRADDRQRAWEEWTKAVEGGKRNPWDEIHLPVRPTFTFSVSERSRNFMQTGDHDEYRELLQECVRMATGFSPSDVEYDTYERITNAVVPEDCHLFIPFSSGAIPMEKQKELFPRYPLEEARAYLLFKAPLPEKRSQE